MNKQDGIFAQFFRNEAARHSRQCGALQCSAERFTLPLAHEPKPGHRALRPQGRTEPV
jgi:hypothetical protein